MLKSFYKKIVNIGIVEGQPDYLQKKIMLSNKLIAIIIFFLALPFLLLSFFVLNKLLIVLIITNVMLLVLLWMNSIGLEKVTRVILAILPLGIVTIFNIWASTISEKPATHIPMMAVLFALFPFLLFDLREKRSMIFTAIITISLLLWFDRWAAVGLGYKETTLGMISFSSVLACIIGVAMFYNLISQNKISEEKAESLIDEMKKNNSLLNQSQDELNYKLEELEVAREEEKKRNWTSEGLAKFGDILRSDKDLVNLSDEVLSKLVKYINANQGGLYSVRENNSETYIELVSSYAYNQKKFNEKRIEIGQGLLGQTYKEKSYKYLTEVPQGYIEITSGLGEATPEYLLIVPMMVNDKVEGLIELASFHEIEQYEIDFVKKLGEQLASSMSAKNIEENTKLLLKETQIQTQEMQEQEEVMRQNMEELQAIQEDMNRTQLENLAQNTALNNAALVSETDRKGVITYVNDTFCKFSEYTKDELIGQNHNIIRHPDMPKKMFKDLWATIGKGKVWRGRVKNQKKSGEFYWVIAIITPVVGKDGKPEKYVGVRFDITEEVLQEEAYLEKIGVLEAAV